MAKDINIGGRLHSTATGNVVAGANEILDDTKGKKQSVVNQETDNALEALDGRAEALEAAVGTGGSVDTRITAAKAEIIGNAASDYNTLGKVEDKILAEVARATTAENDRYTKSETYTKTELNNLITTPNQEYVTVVATDQTSDVTDVLPASGSADTIYRVCNWDGSAASGSEYDVTCYSEYAWDGTEYQFLCVKSQIGEVFDISAYNSNTEYVDLAAALGNDGANVPVGVRRGGMSVKFKQIVTPASYTVVKTEGLDSQPTGTEIFSDPDIDSGTYNASQLSAFSTLPESTGAGNAVTYWMEVAGDTTTYTSWVITMAQSSANKYVQHRLMAQSFTTDVTKWQGVDDEPTADSENLVKSGGVAQKLIILKNISNNNLLKNSLVLDNGTVITNNSTYIYYYPAIEGATYKLTNVCDGSGYHHVVVLDSNDNVLGSFFSAGSAVNNLSFTCPENADKIAINNTSLWHGTLVEPVLILQNIGNLNDINNSILQLQKDLSGDIENLENEIEEINDNIDGINVLKDYYPSTYSNVYDNGFMLDNGNISNNNGYNIYYYNVEEGDLCKLTNICLGSGFHQIIFLDINDSVLSTLVNAGNSIENYSFTIPSSAVKIAVNTSKWSSLVIPTLSVQNYINGENINNSIETLQRDVEELQDEIVTKDTDLLVKIANNQLYVRTSFDETKDIITSWEIDNINHQLSQKYCWLGSKESSFNDIISQSAVHNAEDSIPPMNTHNYWFFTGLHTYVMPKVTIDVELSDDNIGSIWRDSRNYQYKIQSIDGYNVSLIPIIIANGDGAGKDSKGWYYGDNMESTLYHVSGGTYTQDITVSSTGSHSSVIVVNDYKKIFLDNTEISEEGEYKGNELKVIENTKCLDPKTITDFDDLTGDVLFNCTRTYTFCKTTITCRELFDVNTYMWGVDYGSQPMGLRSFGDYSPMIIIPKCKAFNYDGNVFDWKYPVDCSSVRAGLKTYYYNIAEDVETVNDMPDRVIEYHKDETNNLFGIGYASGLSLISGMTQKSIRSNYTNLAFNFSNDNRNKVYFKGFFGYSPQSHEAFEINRYYSYFNPNGDALTYYYKEGNKIVVYVHCYALVSNGNINLPIDFDGKEVTETIEKTDNIQLITTTVTGKILKFKTTSATYSYIVFVIQ